MWLGKSSDVLLQSALMGFECDTRRLLVSGLSVINPTSEKKNKNKVRFGFEGALNEKRFIRIYPLGTPYVSNQSKS